MKAWSDFNDKIYEIQPYKIVSFKTFLKGMGGRNG